jgi:SAM-dependent methyltransferase
LDVGCGPGSFISTLPDDVDSTGVDVTNVQVEYARNKYGRRGKRFTVIAPGVLPFHGDSFDIVTLLELVEHISAREAEVLLGEVFRVLRPRGKIVLTTPNYASLWPLLEILVNRFGGVAYGDQHITKYVGASLRRLIAQAGFREVSVETWLFSAPFVAALSWGLADRVNRWESALVARRGGHLLIGTACKP